MSKIKFIALLWSIVILASCSDDPEVPTITPPSESESTIQVNGASNIGSIQVKAVGNWTATVVEEDADWIYLENTQGKGNGEIIYSIDRNVETSSRIGTIRVSNGTQSVDYRISQEERLLTSESNSEDDGGYLGCGVAISAPGGTDTGVERFFSATNVVKYSTFKKLEDVEPILTLKPSTETTFSFTDLREYQRSERKITADLKVDISYGLFKLGLSGHFNMYGQQMDSVRCFGASANMPISIMTLNYANLNEYATDDEYKSKRTMIFTSRFLNCLDSIESCVANGTTDWYGSDKQQQKLKKALTKLDKYFGPLIATQITTGGLVDIDFRVKEMEAVDTLNIYGKLEGSFSSLFSLDVAASAEYLNTNKSFMSGSELQVRINGGPLDAQTNLISKLSNLVSPGETYSSKVIIEAIADWSKSLTPTYCTPIRCSVTGIWELFSDDAAEVIKSYFLERYPNQKKGEEEYCPYLYDIQIIAGK